MRSEKHIHEVIIYKLCKQQLQGTLHCSDVWFFRQRAFLDKDYLFSRNSIRRNFGSVYDKSPSFKKPFTYSPAQLSADELSAKP